MKVSSWFWDFADSCDMKVSSWVLALLLASTPVLMSGSAYADCGSSNCKSEEMPPLDNSVPPTARSTAAAVFADTCGGSGCKSEDPPPLDQSAAPAVSPAAPVRIGDGGCSGSNCKDDSDDASIAPDRRRADCAGSNCKSEDTPPVDGTVPLLTAPPERIAPQVDQSNARAFILYLPVPPPTLMGAAKARLSICTLL
jgi:hypothetical protein